MYYVIEIQTSENQGAVIPFTFTDLNHAYSKYHALLSVAAVSNVPKHGAMLFNDESFVIANYVFNHESEQAN